MRDSLAAAVALLAAILVVGAPVSLAVRDTWRPELTVLLVVGALACPTIVLVAFAWAWRHKPPATDPELLRALGAGLGAGAKLTDYQRKLLETQQAALPDPTWDTPFTIRDVRHAEAYPER
jgi:drug/metabolite transporter (DMT)-like permease